MKKCIRHPFFTPTNLTLLITLLILPLALTNTHAQLKPDDLVVLDPLGGGKLIGAIYSVDSDGPNRSILSSFDNTDQGPRLFTGNNVEMGPTGHIYLMSGRQLLRVNPFTGFRKILSNLDDPLEGTGVDSTFTDTLTPGATTGTAEFEASSDIFIDADVGALLLSGCQPTDPVESCSSAAVIVEVGSASVVLANILSPFPDTEPIQPSNWFLRGVLRGVFEGLAVADDGQIYATVPNDQLLLRIDAATGFRTIINNLGDSSKGPTVPGADRILLEDQATLLLLDVGLDKIVRLDLKTGIRTLVTRFSDPSEGVTGIFVSDFALEASGHILVTERFNRQLIRVDPTNGFRTLVSDFNDPTSGPVGRLLEGVAVNKAGQIFVVDSQAGGELLVNGAVFEIDPATGEREIKSNFGDNTEGPKGFKPSAITVAIPVSPTPEEMLLIDTVLVATENVEINKGALVTTGNVFANKDQLEAKVTVNKKARTAQGFQLGGNVVVIGKRATVGGDVVWNQRINNQGQILGEETRSPVFPIFEALLPLKPTVTGDANIVITKKGFLSLSPGRFKSITVLKGAILILEGGVYEVETFSVDKGATVIYDQSVEIHASKGVNFDKKSTLRPPNGSTLDAKSAVFYTEGNFDAGKRSSIQAQIIAPLGNVQFGKSARFTGYAQARHIILGKGAIAALNNFLEDAIVPTP